MELLVEAQAGRLANAHARMVEDMERELFTRAMHMAHGNQSQAARWLGVTRTTLREKLRHFGLRGAMPEEDAGGA